jgi:hypothetical protein
MSVILSESLYKSVISRSESVKEKTLLAIENMYLDRLKTLKKSKRSITAKRK